MSTLQIERLNGHAHLAPAIARWHVEEFGHLYDPAAWNAELAERELLAMSADRDGSDGGSDITSDITLVAFDGDGRTIDDVLGSVSLVATDDLAGFEHLSPWLASLYVAPDGRRRGVGSALVDAVLNEARALGHADVHLFTAGQREYYATRGWRTLATVDQRGHEAHVMVRATHPRAARRSVSSKWCSDPDFGGAYSYLRPGATPAVRHRLAGPILPGLWLAGEATWANHPATMHGAWFSGERAAGNVLSTTASGDDVIVVGAGMAGISAARALVSGRSVVVLEASSVIGGRARTDSTLGIPLPLGGAWLHGSEGHPLAPYVSTTPENWTLGATFVVGHGLLDDERRRQAVALRAEVDTVLAGMPPDLTADHAIPNALDQLGEIDPLVRTTVDEWLRIEIENLYAAPLDDFAPSSGYEEYELPGGDQIATSSLEPAIAELARGLDIRLGHRVRRLRYADGRWHTDTGESAAAVIVTVPIGALRTGRIEFDPPLPSDVTDAIGKLGAGPVVKLFATYDTQWWPSDVRPIRIAGGSPLRQAADMTLLTGVPCLCWFATGEAAREIERMTEDEQCRLIDRASAKAGLLGWDATVTPRSGRGEY